MTTDYAEIAAGALESLSDAGCAMTLTVPGIATYNAATGSVTAAQTSYPCTGVKLPPSAMRGAGVTFSHDVVAQAEALVFLAASGLAVVPRPGATLAIGAESWRVIGTDTLAPAGVPVLHALALAN